ncbi:MAG TPA: hypothetical protein PKA55_03945 [Rhodoblastus sp.]|nr:hypothetical protein [Rhodoblastus sp.]
MQATTAAVSRVLWSRYGMRLARYAVSARASGNLRKIRDGRIALARGQFLFRARRIGGFDALTMPSFEK